VIASLKVRLVLAIAALALAVVSATALADVDPASDVLLLQDVYLPYKPKVCSGLSDNLRTLTKRTKDAGYPIKVAVIGSKQDLGGVPQLLNRPQDYARFLGNELGIYGGDVGRNYTTNLHLLVVMPGGFGFFHSGAKTGETPPGLKGATVASGADNNGLARAAVDAIPKVARAAGHPIQAAKGGSVSCSGGGGSSVLIFAAPILVLVLAAGALAGLQKIRGRREEA
jgi:hypothetical protein